MFKCMYLVSRTAVVINDRIPKCSLFVLLRRVDTNTLDNDLVLSIYFDSPKIECLNVSIYLANS